MSSSKLKVIKKRPIKQYLSNETLTDILKSRFKENLTDKETANKHNVSITLTKKIIKKYGDDYIEMNNLNGDLPENDSLKDFWKLNIKNKDDNDNIDTNDE